jgi:KDO2-lipid IV(A) lauroyltransferase
MKLLNTLQSYFLIVLSHIPFWQVYLVSDLVAWVFTHVISYRRRLVLDNLARALPGKSERERKAIMHLFYRNLADVMLEVIKLKSMSQDQINKRMKLTNSEVLKQFDEQGRSVILAAGHFANWEWLGIRVKSETSHQGAAIYKRVANKFYNDFMLDIRNTFEETLMIEHEKTSRSLIRLKNTKILLLVLSDQRPPSTELKYWIQFFGQETPVLPGVEKIATAFDFDVVYFDICRIKRGYYEATFIPLKLAEGEEQELNLTKRYFEEIEKSVHRQPECYLWSHNRWKYDKNNLN